MDVLSPSFQLQKLQDLEDAVQEDLVYSRMCERMGKAVDTTSITAIVPENLELDAYNTQWEPGNSDVLTVLKMVPSVPATQIEHKFVQQTSYGADHGMGEVGERSLPLETQPEFAQRVVNIRMAAAHSSIFKLASLEKTVRVNGQVGATAITKARLLQNLLWRKERGVIFADTTKMRLGAAGLRPKGLIQQIREGTDGTVGTESKFGSHVIDMKGETLTPQNLRKRAAQRMIEYGFPRAVFMSPMVRAEFEDQIDPAQRINLPIPNGGLVLGQHVSGMRTNGGNMMFHTNLMLAPENYQGRYRAVQDDGAPSAPSAVTASAGGSGYTNWDAESIGDIRYIVTEWRDGRESLGRAIASAVTVAAGNRVTLVITPSDPNSDFFRIYRYRDGETTADAWGIFDVANSGAGAAVTAYDENDDRPNTHVVLGLDIESDMTDYIARAVSGVMKDYATPEELRAEFFKMSDRPSNSVAVAHLGVDYGTMELAPVLMTDARPLYFSPYCPQVRGPRKCTVFKNVKTRIDA